jgi:hypothetical protein
MVDDFSNNLHAPWDNDWETDKLRPADVAAVFDSAHATISTGHPEVGFIPYLPAKMLPAFGIPAVVMGVRGCWGTWDEGDPPCPGNEEDYYIYPEGADGVAADLIRLDTTFNPGAVPAGGSYNLSFMVYDMVGETLTDRSLDLIVEVNGVEVTRYSLFDVLEDGDYMAVVEADVRDLIPDAENTLSMRVEAGTHALNRFFNKLVFVWDMRLNGPGGELVTFPLDDMSFVASRDPSRASSSTDQFVAGTNEEWLVFDSLDGLHFKYSFEDAHLDPAVHERFVQSACRPFASEDKPCIEVYWGNDQWHDGEVSLDLDSVSLFFEHSQEHADGIVVWRLENHANELGLGVMGERAALDPDSYDVASGYPSFTSATPGWFHAWTVTAVESGVHTLRWADNKDSGAEERMYKRVLVGDGVTEDLVYEQDITDVETSGEATFTVSAGERVTVQFATLASFGSVEWYVQYRLLGPGGDVLRLDEGDFEAGIDPTTRAMFDCTAAFFTSHTYPEVCR